MVSATVTRQRNKAVRAICNVVGGHVKTVTWSIDSNPSVCEISFPTKRIEEFRQYDAGYPVHVQIQKSGKKFTIFQGWITGRTFEYDPNSEEVTIVCLDARWRLSNDFIKGQYIENADGEFRALTGRPCVFNRTINNLDSDSGNGAIEKNEDNGVRPFALDYRTEDESVSYTINDMIWYIYTIGRTWKNDDIIGDILKLSPSGIGVLGTLTVNNVDVDGMNLTDAIQTVMDKAAVRWWTRPISEDKSEIKVHLSGATADEVQSATGEQEVIANNKPKKLLNLDAVGNTINGFSNTNMGRIQEDFANIYTSVHVYGDAKKFQKKIELIKGWNLTAEDDLINGTIDDIRRDTNQETSINWPKYKDVGRKYVTNEAGNNAGLIFDFNSLFGSEEYARTYRTFFGNLPDQEDNDVLSVSNSSLSEEKDTQANVRLLDREGGIYIEGGELKQPFFVEKSATNDVPNFAEAVEYLAVVKEDKSQEVSNTALPSQVPGDISTSDLIRRKMAIIADEYEFDNKNFSKNSDNLEKMTDISSRELEKNKKPRISGSFTIPWISVSYEPLDLLAGIAGSNRNVFFTAQVIEVKFDFDSQTTELVVEDFRLANS